MGNAIEIEIDANDLRRLAGGDSTAPRITGATSRPSATAINPPQVPRQKQVEQPQPASSTLAPAIPIFQGQVLGAPADNTLAAMWPEWSDPS